MNDVNILIKNGVNVEKSLELFGDMATYDETLTDFLSDVEERLKNLESYKEIADMGNYAILVHSLKSDMRYFGFDQVADMCLLHEQESKANHIYYIYDHYDELVSNIEKMVNVAREYLGESVIEPVKETVTEPLTEAILVVDDSNVIQKFIQKIFADRYQVLVANEGEQAVQFIEKEGDHIVGMLLDLNMPNINGFIVLNYFQARDLFDKIPVSIITGVGNEEAITKARTYPIIDVLRKPFNERDLKAIVEKTVAKAKIG